MRCCCFTAHSIPLAMADGCRYEEQLREACRLVAEGVSGTARLGSWSIKAAAGRRSSRGWSRTSATSLTGSESSCSGRQRCRVVPIGFISDHMEVLYDLDTEARQLCERARHQHGPRRHGRHASAVRANDPRADRGADDRRTATLALGILGPSHDVCPDDCCLYTPSRPTKQITLND